MAYKKFCINKSAENWLQYTNLKNQKKKVNSKSHERKRWTGIKKTEYKTSQYFQIGEVHKNRWERYSREEMHKGKKCKAEFQWEDQGKIWKVHKVIMNEENVWDQMTEADIFEGPIQMVTEEKSERERYVTQKGM